jgi:hypothetical protein
MADLEDDIVAGHLESSCDRSANTIDLLIYARRLQYDAAVGERGNQTAIVVAFDPLGARRAKADKRRVGTRPHDEIEFERTSSSI